MMVNKWFACIQQFEYNESEPSIIDDIYIKREILTMKKLLAMLVAGAFAASTFAADATPAPAPAEAPAPAASADSNMPAQSATAPAPKKSKKHKKHHGKKHKADTAATSSSM